MSYAAISDIAGLFVNVFGSPLIASLFIFGFIAFCLTMIRVHWSVMLFILLPVVLTLGFTPIASQLVHVPKTVVWIFLLVTGLCLFIFFYFINR